MKNKRWLTVLILIFATLFSACTSDQDIKSIKISRDAFCNATSFMESKDGGYHELQGSESNAKAVLEDTYYSLSSLKLLNLLKDANTTSIKKHLGYIKYKDVIFNNDTDINSAYLFFKVSELVGFKINESLAKDIQDYVSSLQSKEGYFNRTNNEQAIDSGNSEKSSLDPAILSNLKRAIYILKDSISETNKALVISCISRLLDSIDESSFIIDDLAVIELAIDVEDTFALSEKTFYLNRFANYCNKWIDNFNNQTSEIFLLEYLSRYASKYFKPSIYNNINEQIMSYYNEGTFLLYSNSQISNISFVDSALRALYYINVSLSNEKIIKIRDTIIDSELYDGMFSFISIPSTFESSYYKYLITDLLNQKDTDLVNYVSSSIQDGFDTKADEPFYLALLAELLPIQYNHQKIFQYISKILADPNDSNIPIDSLALCIATANQIGYHFSDANISNIKGYLKSVENEVLEADKSRADKVQEGILLKLLDCYIMHMIGQPYSKEYILAIAKEFSKNIDFIKEKLYIGSWLVTVLKQKGIVYNEIDSYILITKSLIKEASEYNNGLFFKYSDNFAMTFKSTYDIITTLDYFKAIELV
ncbi:MAG: hypothetical protein VB064_13205 [Oscillospiraceae bacterium]|nr:hypothetical protein [Oscillospiraceae bacterium]